MAAAGQPAALALPRRRTSVRLGGTLKCFCGGDQCTVRPLKPCGASAFFRLEPQGKATAQNPELEIDEAGKRYVLALFLALFLFWQVCYLIGRSCQHRRATTDISSLASYSQLQLFYPTSRDYTTSIPLLSIPLYKRGTW